MTEQSCCALCGAAGHVAAQCNWNERRLTFTPDSLAAALNDVQCLSDLGPELIAASVFRQHPEQAEGTQGEPAGGERWDALQSIMEWTAAENIPDDRKLCLIRNAARAALAQPSPSGEYGDAYQGAREDLAIWKRRALEAEARLAELEKQRPFYYFADCDDPDASRLYNTEGDALSQISDYGGAVVKLYSDPVAPAPAALPPFAEKVLGKLRRFYDCASDFESGGVDIGRHWLDLLTQLGLLNRVQRSPALWEISQQGEDLLEAPVAQAGQAPQAWLDVQAERRRQVAAEGWTPEHDNEHDHGQMARAAACYALAGSSAADDKTTALLVSLAWPWDQQWWKPRTARDNLVRAGALVLAEIERLDRAQAQGRQAPEPQTTGHDRLWHWFGLSRSAYAIMPRVMMHAMPDDWQDRMATLLEEWMAFWPNMPDIDACVQIRRAGRMIPTPPWLLNYRHPDRQHLADIHGGALERPSCVEP